MGYERYSNVLWQTLRRQRLKSETVRDEIVPRPDSSLVCKYSIPTGDFMAFKPNYRLQRTDRNRAARARNEEKTRQREKKSANCKA
jgi:hypothetical protein